MQQETWRAATAYWYLLLRRQSLGVLGRSQARHKSSRFNGVYWKASAGKFEAQLCFHRIRHYLGIFDCEEDAARSYDERLRSLCSLGARLKKSLNFPSTSEQLFTESPQETRARALVSYGDNGLKEKLSFWRLRSSFQSSNAASGFEIVRVAGASRADALFRPVGFDAGIRLQLKSATAVRSKRATYIFQHTSGYDGMALILIALDREMFWIVPGKLVTQTCLSVRLGTSRDKAWRASDIGRVLEECFKDTQTFPHVPLQKAKLECNVRGKVEQQAHRLMVKLFASIGFKLSQPLLAPPTVDSLLMGWGWRWHVQEKAANASSGRYLISLAKRAGALGRVAYAKEDFDVLLAAILDEEHLSGLFIFPVHILEEHGLVEQKARTLRVYPPWSLPKKQATKAKHAWQLDFFVDLHRWPKESSLPRTLRACLEQRLHSIKVSCTAKDAHIKGRTAKVWERERIMSR